MDEKLCKSSPGLTSCILEPDLQDSPELQQLSHDVYFVDEETEATNVQNTQIVTHA